MKSDPGAGGGCERYGEVLSAYIDDELTAAELTDLAEHLKTCSRCAREMDALLAVKNLLHQAEPYWPVDRPRPDLAARVVGRLREEGADMPVPPARLSTLRKGFFPLAAALTALLLAVGTISWFQERREERIASRPAEVREEGDGYLLALGGARDGLGEYLREHALGSANSVLVDTDAAVEVATYDAP